MRCTILTKRVADTSISMFITAASEVYRQICSELTQRWQHGTLNFISQRSDHRRTSTSASDSRCDLYELAISFSHCTGLLGIVRIKLCLLITFIRHDGSTHIPGAPKSSPLKNFCYFLTTTDSCYIKFYRLLTHSLRRKPGKFYCITYRNDKTALP